MPQQTYTVTAPNGRTLDITGDRVPTEVELRDIFKAAGVDVPDAPVQPQPEHPHARTARLVGEAVTGAGKAIAGIPTAIYQTVTDPIGTIKGIGEAQGRVGQQAAEAFQKGDYLRATIKGVEYLIPIAGPMMSAAGDKMEQGDIAEAIGELGTNALLTFAPMAPRTPKTKPPIVSGPSNAKDAAAVAFARREGVPLDLGTASGSQLAKNAQKRIGNTLAGDAPASALQEAQAQALTRTGERLAGRAGPTPQTPVSAGESVRAAITKGIEADHATASQAYGKIRAVEDAEAARIAKIPAAQQATMDAAQRTPLMLDVSVAVKEMLPLYKQLKREQQSGVPMAGGRGKTLAALEGLMESPGYASLSVVDTALSDLKAMARGAAMPELRTSGQATAAQAVHKLDALVRATASRYGLLKELEAGRAATKAKYAKADVLDLLSGEPGQVFRQLTQNKDVALQRLRAVQQVAPKELPNIARAYLEDMMQTATQEGGFAHADKLWADWNKLGGETKRRLFPQAGHVEALDQFFLLAKRIKENPNPSGTAQVLTAPRLNLMEALAYIPAKITAQILFNPKAVRYLTAARVASRNPSRAAQSVAIANLTKAAQSAGVPLEAIPALTVEPERTTPSGPRR